jgi:PPOX class probable F420-dependent enzyme
MAEFPESHRDLVEQVGVAMLSTVGSSGYPQVTAVAFFLDPEDNELKLSLNTTRQKTKNLVKNPKCTLFFLDPNNSGRTLEVRADAELTPDDDFSFCARAGAKYGSDFRRNDKPGETRVVVTLHPTRIVTWGPAAS